MRLRRSRCGFPRGPATLAALILTALVPALTAPRVAPAQETEELRRRAEQELGRPVSDQEILRRLRQSGLTPQQIRERLRQRGYPPEAAEPYLAVLEGRASSIPQGTNPLPLLSVITRAEVGLDTLRYGQIPPDSLAMLRELEPEELGPPVFGREVFRRATSQFRPVTTGPVPSDYRLGPGDQLILVLTGAVEQAYELNVSREGWTVIPDVGRVYVNGKTLEELRETLFARLSQAYSGIERGPGATTFFDVSVGDLRTNQVYVIGEVEQPSAYTVSSLSTAMNALYHARGPTRQGSFRNVLVNRGGETVARIDLYDYLLRGVAGSDVRLQHGDVVFVPVARRQVEVTGPVTRPGIYEMKEGENLADLLEFAGGTRPNAVLERVQIRRILPADQRSPGNERAVLDVPVARVEDGQRGGVPLVDGDRVHVFAVVDEARNQVTVSGAVWRPGTYGAGPDTRIWDVIRAAGGLLPDVFTGRAQIQRLRPDYSRRMIPVSLARDAGGEPVENPRVEGMDQVYVYAKRDLREERAVSIGGWVQEPGVYPFVGGMTVADLILKAGGLRTGAYVDQAEVARVVISQTRTDTLTRRFTVPLDSALVFDRPAAAADGGPGEGPAGGRGEIGPAARFELENLDAVYVRKAPGFEPQKRVVVTGEVQFPGPYSLRTRDERLTDLVRRAGGLTSEGYAEGFQLWRAEPAPEVDTLTAAGIAGQAVGDTTLRTPTDTAAPRTPADTAARRRAAEAAQQRRQEEGDGRERRQRPDEEETHRTRVGVDFVAALENPSGSQNIFVEPNDSIFVPRYIPTVDVRGAVGVETKVLYREGSGLDYYIDQAGGYAENADEGRVWIRFANGEVATKGGGFLFFAGGIPDPDPGATINVPREPPKQPGTGISTAQFLSIITSITTATIVALSR